MKNTAEKTHEAIVDIDDKTIIKMNDITQIADEMMIVDFDSK